MKAEGKIIKEELEELDSKIFNKDRTPQEALRSLILILGELNDRITALEERD